jgi:hypothetical protein
VASLCPGQACRFGFRVTFCTGSRCNSAAIAVVCFSQKALAAQAPIVTGMLSGIQQGIQQMLTREKCLIRTLFISLFTIVALAAQPALADDVDTAIENFRGAGAGDFIDDSYGYAVFPSIGKGGIGQWHPR